MKKTILFIISFASIVVCAIADNSFAAFIAGIIIIAAGIMLCMTVNAENRDGAFKTLYSVIPIYVISAYIFSLSFDQNNFFAVSDSMRYLQYYQGSRAYFRESSYLVDTYIRFTDNNGLYNSYIQCWAAIGNLNLDGASVFYMTLAQTLFGVLCSVILYRIIARLHKKSPVKYAVTFSCCSLFLFYSSVIIRDITVAFFFLYALDYLTQHFKLRRLFYLILFGFIVWGIRLYSGLFYFIFPMCYVVFRLTKNSGKKATIIFFILLGLFVLPVVAVTSVGEQTQEEIEEYQNFTLGRNENGLFNKLAKLPPGIKEVALTLFSQISPFPPHNLLIKSENFSQVYMGVDHFVFEFFWFFVFFMLAYLCIINGRFRLLGREEIILLIIAMLYIVVNTAHPDIRRMMPVYPIIYLLYLKIINKCSQREVYNAKNKLRILYVFLFVFALIYRG